MTVREFAALCGVHYNTVSSWCHKGIIPCTTTVRNNRVIITDIPENALIHRPYLKSGPAASENPDMVSTSGTIAAEVLDKPADMEECLGFLAAVMRGDIPRSSPGLSYRVKAACEIIRYIVRSGRLSEDEALAKLDKLLDAMKMQVNAQHTEDTPPWEEVPQD